MKEVSKSWLYELESTLHPSNINPDEWESSHSKKFISNLLDNVRLFRSYLIAQLGYSKQQAKASLIQVIMVSDIINSNMVTIQRSRKNDPRSTQIKLVFHQTLVILEALLDHCNRYEKGLFAELPLTAFSIPNIRMKLRKRLELFRSRFTNSNTKTELRDLILSGLQLLIKRQHMSRSDAEYASLILDKMERLDPLSRLEVENLLYQYDFNTPAFFHYCAKCCNNQIILPGTGPQNHR